jgi:hypothetical protein
VDWIETVAATPFSYSIYSWQSHSFYLSTLYHYYLAISSETDFVSHLVVVFSVTQPDHLRHITVVSMISSLSRRNHPFPQVLHVVVDVAS